MCFNTWRTGSWSSWENSDPNLREDPIDPMDPFERIFPEELLLQRIHSALRNPSESNPNFRPKTFENLEYKFDENVLGFHQYYLFVFSSLKHTWAWSKPLGRGVKGQKKIW